jgi:head-tail adaptor
MKRLTVLLLLIPFLAVGLSGCVPVFLMAVGGVGVYATSKDTIQGDTDTPYEALWDAAMKVARIRGTILQEDFNRGYIEVDAKPNKIWIRFERVTAAATKIKVSARKYKLPNIDLAQEVFIKIVEETKRSS